MQQCALERQEHCSHLLRTDTDFSDFKYVVEEKECFVSPVVEILHYNDGDSASKTLRLHTLRIPHCLRNTSQLNLIRVRRGRSSSRSSFRHIPLSSTPQVIGNSYSINDHFITISAREFSEFVCTSCDTTCNGELKVFFFGNLNASRMRNVTTVKINSFLCSPLFNISEFRELLFKVQGKYQFSPLRERSLEINTTDVDNEQNHVVMKLYRAQTEKNSWTPIMQDVCRAEGQELLLQKKTMHWANVLDSCHQCRRLDPTEAVVVDIVTDGLCSDFHGIFDVVVQPAINGSNEKQQEDLGTQIFFEVYGELPLPEDTSHQTENDQSHYQKALTVKKLLKIAKRLHDKIDIIQLALNLDLEQHTTNAIFADNTNSINVAAYEMLCTWFSRQGNQNDAQCILGEALIESDLNKIAREILHYPPKAPEKGLENVRPRRIWNCNVS